MRLRTCCFPFLLLALVCSVQFGVAQTTSLLTVSGTVYEENLPSQTPMQVTVSNLERTQIAPGIATLGAAGTGKFSVVFFDPFGAQIMGAVGDRLEVKLTDPSTGQLIKSVEHSILGSEIVEGFGDVIIDIHLEIAEALTFRQVGLQQAKPGRLLAFKLELTEALPNVEYGMIDPPIGVQLDPVTGVFAWVPDEAQIGDYGIRFTAAADGRVGLMTVQVKVIPLFPTTTILLIEGTAYDAPNVPTIRDVTVHVRNLNRDDVSGSIKVGTTEPGRFSLLLFDPISGRFMGRSGELLEIRAVLGDGEELVSVLHEITDDDIVINGGVIALELLLNRAPILDLVPPQTVRVGQNFRLLLEASDPDGDALQFASADLPVGSSLDTRQGIFQWVPRTEGSFSVKFEVTDGKEGHDEQVIDFTVLPNSAPVFDPIPSIPVVEVNVPLEIVLSAQDPDGDEILYLVTGAPLGTNFEQDTGRFSWTPSQADVGITYALTFGVIDLYNALSTFSTQITVLAAPSFGVEMSVVEPSTLTIEEYLGSVGYLVRVTNLGNRQDTFQLNLEADDALMTVLEPVGISLEPNGATEVGLLVRSQQRTPAGEYQVVVRAVSGSDPEQQASVTVTTVVLVHTVLEVEPATLQFDTLNSVQTLLVRNAGTGVLNWQIQGLPAWLSTDVIAGETADETKVSLNTNLAGLDPGDYSATFQVADDAGTEVPVDVQLTVFEPRMATLRLQPASQEAAVGRTVTLNLQLESETPVPYLEFGFAFDPSILQFTELSSASPQLQWDYGRINNEVGQTTRPYEVSNEDGSAVNGLDLQLHFDVVGAGSTAISLLRLLLQADDQRTDFRIAKIPAKVDSIFLIPAWDINADGVTDIVDLVLVGQHFGETDPTEGDVNGDGVVDILDLVTIGAHFGEQWEQLASPAAHRTEPPLVWQVRSQGQRIVGELQALEPIYLAGWSLELTALASHLRDFQVEMGPDWASDSSAHHTTIADDDTQRKRLATARLSSGNAEIGGTLVRVSWSTDAILGSPDLLESIASRLELTAQLVNATGDSWSWRSAASTTRILPSQTQLGPNFPNPFNPETWIPFRLSNSGEAQVRIYSVQGQLVRTLALGSLAAGIYETRERAAYWDGCDQTGTRVASGVYYYQLAQGSFSVLRRCVIRK